MNFDIENGADELFLSGDLASATIKYSELMKNWKTDPNNNEQMQDDDKSLPGNEYFVQRISECDKKIELFPKNSAYYLEKAAVYFFMDEWEKARDVLAAGLSNCNDKSKIRSTLGNLNKLERFLASADKSTSH